MWARFSQSLLPWWAFRINDWDFTLFEKYKAHKQLKERAAGNNNFIPIRSSWEKAILRFAYLKYENQQNQSMKNGLYFGSVSVLQIFNDQFIQGCVLVYAHVCIWSYYIWHTKARRFNFHWMLASSLKSIAINYYLYS